MSTMIESTNANSSSNLLNPSLNTNSNSYSTSSPPPLSEKENESTTKSTALSQFNIESNELKKPEKQDEVVVKNTSLNDTVPLKDPNSFTTQEVTNPSLKNENDFSQTVEKPGSRRIIAEDNEWNLTIIEPLTKLCINMIVEHFQERPILKGLPPHYRREVLNRISLDIPAPLLVDIIPDELYWHRRSIAQHENCDIETHGGSWKRLFCERTLEKELANFTPNNGEDFGFSLLAIQLSSCIKRLKIDQLRPITMDSKTRNSIDAHPDHMDPNLLVDNLPNLKDVSFYYGMRQLGMQFAWHLFGMTENDSLNLSKALKRCKWETLSLSSCLINNSKLARICEGLVGHTYLRSLKLDHNKISDEGVIELSKWLLTDPILEHLNLANNKIGSLGAAYLSKALFTNTKLASLCLRLNPLGNDGALAIACALVSSKRKGPPLKVLDLACTGIGASALNQLNRMIEKNLISELDLSCNLFSEFSESQETEKEALGKTLWESVLASQSIKRLDLRGTDIPENVILNIQIAIQNKQMP